MPQQDQSSKIGTSSSPTMERVIENNKNTQRTFPDNTTAQSYNKQTVDVPGAGK